MVIVSVNGVGRGAVVVVLVGTVVDAAGGVVVVVGEMLVGGSVVVLAALLPTSGAQPTARSVSPISRPPTTSTCLLGSTTKQGWPM
jgi:hypothetical protein